MQFTKAQQRAIYTEGSSLLVSAAAGSGKTAVLVQRVIEKIMAGADISGLWIMTFSQAAAAEMHLKIEKAIAAQLAADPDNAHLQRQTLLLPSANISTIHSVCKRLIDMNFQVLGLDPSVGIGDEAELEIVFNRTLEELAEQLYERALTEPLIKELVSFFSSGRNDDRLLSVLSNAYKIYEEQPFPKTEFVTAPDLFDNFVGDNLFVTVDDKLSEVISQYAALLEDPYYLPVTESTLWQSMFKEQDAFMLAQKHWRAREFDKCAEALCGFKFGSWNVSAKLFKQAALDLTAAKINRTYAKDIITSLRSAVFSKSEQRHMRDITVTNRVLTTLFGVIEQLDACYTQAKRDKNVISFADMEQMAVRLLIENYDETADTVTPTPLAGQLGEQIDQIIVDEYQDTNRKQDLIFRALSRNGQNVFMVGDVKQSIYRFRGGCPELFMQKKNSSFPAEESYQITRPSYLYLNQNFRSHPVVLDFANQIFSSVMSSGLGEIDYDVSEQLYPGGLYPEESEGHVEFDVILTDKTDEDDETAELTAIEKEAAFVAGKIRELHGTPFYDVKVGKERPLCYGDMAILCRVAGGVTGSFETALRRQGINSINNNQDLQFLDVWEIKMLRAFLQVISNPYRDIPLITLMYSDFYCFSAAELAEIRLYDKHVSFYDALCKAACDNVKAAEFLRQVEELRYAAVGRRTDEILQMIFAATHILEKVACYPDGKERVANMQLMLRYAIRYENNSYKGLFSFLHYLDKMSELNKILPGARSADTPEECVQLLSTHKSKGLEYPVCFVVNLSRSYRDREREKLVHHSKFGTAAVIREDERFTEYTSLPYELIYEVNRRETLSEEMRILYVALTRPKTHLYLVTSAEEKQIRSLLESVSAYCGCKPSEFLAESPSALRWVLFALRHQKGLAPLYEALETAGETTGENCHFTTVVYKSVQEGGVVRATKEREELYSPDLELIRKAYPYQVRTTLPVKLSVSEVKGMREKDPEAAELIPEHFGRRRPSFLRNATAGNAVGNAVHKFMQFADFKALAAPDGFEREKERLMQKDFLTSAEIALVPSAQIEGFVRQPLFRDMITADVLEKEKRFFFSLPADRLFAGCGETEPILLQGVLDCFYEKNGQLIIVDYKTDRLSDPKQFVERYGLQLRLYRYALKQIYGKKADKLYIYSFYLGEVIEIS
ncbi:MAG: helicase-exonuclease AddAB subunit AddA [Clostridia bacterium]|nr:helicase-exonuclease AddAB subunit AddA [Clostridia bacterium]